MLRDCWLPANLPRHTGMPTRVHSVQALAAEQLDYWDVVEYQHPIGSTRSGSQNPALRLGLVQQVCHLKALQLYFCRHTTEDQKAPRAASIVVYVYLVTCIGIGRGLDA